jgi:hypothetical protein
MNLKAFDDENSMVNFLTNETNSSKFLAGVSFLNESIRNFEYKLRFPYTTRFKKPGSLLINKNNFFFIYQNI